MRAAVVEKAGAVPVAREVEAIKPGPTDVLVRIHAAGVNPIDWKRADGHAGPVTFPMVMGQDFAGTVEDAGAQATRFSANERVFGAARTGAYAELADVPVDGVMTTTPEWLDDARAAALPVPGLTALALVEEVQLQRGQTVLIVGATGAVGSLASQIARSRGAYVIGTARSGQEEAARNVGVGEVIAYDRENVADAVRRVHPDGIDAIIDVVSKPDELKRLAGTLRKGGHVISTVGSVDTAWCDMQQLHGTNMMIFRAKQWSRDGLDQLVALIESKAITSIVVRQAPLADAGQIITAGRAGTLDGKYVLVP